MENYIFQLMMLKGLLLQLLILFPIPKKRKILMKMMMKIPVKTHIVMV